MKTEMFGYVPGGYARILERFTAMLEEEGVDIETGSAGRADRAGGRRLRRSTSGEATLLHFDRVVVTAAAPLAARICEGLSEDERDRLEGVVYNGVICASAAAAPAARRLLPDLHHRSRAFRSPR